MLVADDNKVNRLLLCRSLELMGHEVASVDNGRAALEKLRSEHFDLLLLDLEMPEVDGFGLLAQRADDAALSEVPVIVTSSLEGAAPVARCIEPGADDYLHKPVNPVLLQARVDSSLERKRLRDRQRELLARLAPGPAAGFPSPDEEPAAASRLIAATLLAARLCDVDTLALSEPSQAALDDLNNWTTLMLDAVEEHGGLVHQIAGDSIAAVFGANDPLPGGADAPWAATQAALEMLQLVAMFNAERSRSGKAPIALGVGIASGDVLTGYAGTPKRAGYACIGAAVHRAVQLAALSGHKGGTILVDAAIHAGLAGRVGADALPPAGATGSPNPVYALRAG